MTTLTHPKLYDSDFYAWTERQAELVHTEEFEAVDWNNLIEESPSLRTLVAERVAIAYPRAGKDALEESGFLRSPFPATCSYAAEQILDEAFWPEG